MIRRSVVIVDELPFHFMEGEGFQVYLKHLEHRFDIFSHHTMVKDIIKL